MIGEVPKIASLPSQALDDQIKSLIARYGVDALREAVARFAKKKRGRKAEKDWPLLKPWCEQDTADWLAGRDPFALRSNYSVAKDFAQQFPGHDLVATNARIKRKLKANRRGFMLAGAWQMTERGYPHKIHLKALRDLEDYGPAWEYFLATALDQIARFKERFGELDDNLSIGEIEDKLANALSVRRLADLTGLNR